MYFSKPHLIRYCILIERNDAIRNNPSELLCSCLDALRHPFLCGPRWRVVPSMDIIRWGLGSTAVRIAEEYIYGQPQVHGYFLNPISWFLFSFKLSIPPWWIGSHCFILLVMSKHCHWYIRMYVWRETIIRSLLWGYKLYFTDACSSSSL